MKNFATNIFVIGLLLFLNGFSWFSDASFVKKEEAQKIQATQWHDPYGIIIKKSPNQLTFWQNDDAMVGSDTARVFIIKTIEPTDVNRYKATVFFHGIESEFNVLLDLEKGKLTFVDAKQSHRSFYFLQDKKRVPVATSQEISSPMVSKALPVATESKSISNDAALTKSEADRYKYGIDVAGDQQKAMELYGRAAKMGDAGAMEELALYYEEGLWVSKDRRKAKEFLEKAIQAGSVSAQWQLEMLEEN